jgi:DtxR family Mn-dependent transcriptional regulator
MSQKYTLTPSEEEYLEAIYTKQEGAKRAATTRDLAECLGVKDASVTEMLKKLSEKGMIHYTPYHGATLTEAGRKIAAKVKRKHRILERFLVDICGVDKHESHKQACEIEHVISDKAIDTLSVKLGRSLTCPGGSAIPEGECQESGTKIARLSDVGRGAYEVRFLTSPEPETISRLCSLGLIPGLTVKVLRKIANGPIIIEMKDTQIALDRDVAASLLVSPKDAQNEEERKGESLHVSPGDDEEKKKKGEKDERRINVHGLRLPHRYRHVTREPTREPN